MAEFAKLVGDADLAISRPVQRKRDDDRLNVGRRAVLEDRFAPRQLLQRQFAAGVVQLLGAIETVARVAHHFAGLADIAELPGQLQQPYLGADDLLFLGHRRCPFETPRPGATQPRPTPRPASASASAMTPTVRLSLNYCKEDDDDRHPRPRPTCCHAAKAPIAELSCSPSHSPTCS